MVTASISPQRVFIVIILGGNSVNFFFFTQWAITITGHNRTWCEELKCCRERLELSREFNKDIYSWAVICKCVILAFASLLKR